MCTSFVSFMFILTGVDDVSLEFNFGGLRSEDVRLVRTGGEAADLPFSDVFGGEFIVNDSVAGGDLIV